MTGGKWYNWIWLGIVLIVCLPFVWIWKKLKKLGRWIKDKCAS